MREIWNVGRITETALPSQKPPLQVSPAASSLLEASDDRPLWLSCRDGRVFFDQLRTLPELWPYLGRPQVSITELRCPPPCESGAQASVGLSDAELAIYVNDGDVSEQDLFLTPVICTWPMGFGWSSYVAQSTMVFSCIDAGFREEYVLSGRTASTTFVCSSAGGRDRRLQSF